jgi:hypothetical protein
MTKDEKKELFLLILESWFDDKTGQINSNNCIGFYHYFLDCLEFEAEFSSEIEPGYKALITITIDLLSNFPFYDEYKISEKQGLKNIIIGMDKKINPQKLDLLLGKIHDLYLMFREEYLL